MKKQLKLEKKLKFKKQTATIDATVKQAEKDIEKTVSESKTETLLMDKFTEPTQPIVLAYSFTKKADPAKVNYFVKIANGDLSTQAQIVAAKLVRDVN